MSTDPTAAARQLAARQRRRAAGFIQYRRWIHPEDKPALDSLADRLERRRKKREVALDRDASRE